MSLYSINPPAPQSLSVDEKSLGHHLLRLVRSAEKGNAKSTEELSVVLDVLSETFLRRGLLGGDTERADKIMTAGVKSSNFGRDKKGGNKKNLSMDDENNLEAEGDSGAATDDINLLLSALVRLGGGNHELSSPITDSNLPRQVTIRGFNVCIAFLQHMLSRKRREACALAEYELIAGVARTLLTGVSRTLKGLLETSLDDSVHAIVCSGFRVATLVLSLYGTKLSRNQAILSSLRSLAWNIMSISDERLQTSAGNFLAALPLTGLDKQTPSALWTEGIIDGTAALYLLLDIVAPLKSKLSNALNADKARGHLSETMKTSLSAWVERLQKEDSAEARIVLFNSLTSALTQFIVSLLEAECLVAQSTPVMSSARFAAVEVLDLLESMFAFPSAAESLFYGTKNRLRLEIVDGGLLSPHAIANSAANHVKGNGLKIFNAMLQSLGRSVFLPFGKRVVKLAHSSLLTSCTMTLRYALDPTSSVRRDGKRKKWLHASVELRTKAIDGFNAMVCALGSNALVSPSSATSGTRRVRTTQANKGLTLIVGCLLEQLSSRDVGSENWGSTEELSCLVCAAMKAMASILTQGGGFLSFSSRLLIDSAIKSCLDTYQKRTANNLFSSSEVKLACLQLVSTCLVTPWSDGATTSLVDEMRHATKHLSSDVDMNVASQARNCLQLIHCTKTHRSPPLLIVTRSSGSNETPFSNQEDSASAIVDRLKVVQDSMNAKDPVQEIPTKKSKRKKDKMEEPTDDTAVKRAKPNVEAESKPDPTVPTFDNSKDSMTQEKTPADSVVESKITADEDDANTGSANAEDDIEGDELDDLMPGIVDTGPDDED
jgi:hypothetical protein